MIQGLTEIGLGARAGQPAGVRRGGAAEVRATVYPAGCTIDGAADPDDPWPEMGRAACADGEPAMIGGFVPISGRSRVRLDVGDQIAVTK